MQQMVLKQYLLPLRSDDLGGVKLMLPRGGVEELQTLIATGQLRPKESLTDYVSRSVDLEGAIAERANRG